MWFYIHYLYCPCLKWLHFLFFCHSFFYRLATSLSNYLQFFLFWICTRNIISWELWKLWKFSCKLSIFMLVLIFAHSLNRRCCWNSVSLQMHIGQILYATLLHSSWRVDIHFWWAMDIWSASLGSSCTISFSAKCCTHEVHLYGWLT